MMSGFKSTISLICLFLFSSSVFSQKIFRDGYIIKKNGDFIEGLIAYVPGKAIPKTCIFKRFDIAVEVSYTAGDISAFGYNGGIKYESLKSDGIPAFFKVLVIGDLTLLAKDSKYYIKEPDDRAVEIGGGTIIWQQKNFSGGDEFLVHLAREAGVDLPAKAGLKKDLIPVITAYNLKKGSNYIVQSDGISEKGASKSHVQYDGARTRVGILSGLNNYSLKLSLDNGGYIPSPEQERSLVYGLSFERMIFRRSDKLVFRTGVIYLQQNFYSYSEKIEFNRFTKNDAFFDFKAVKVPFLIQYNIPGMRIIPYVNAGLGSMFLLKKNYLHIVESERTDGSIDTYEDSKFKFAGTEFSATAGAGLKFRIMEKLFLRLEGRFEYGTGIFEDSQFDNLNQYSVQPSLLFGLTF